MSGQILVLALILTMTSCTAGGMAPCSFSTFRASPYDHLIEDLPPATMPELVGRLRVRPMDVKDGVWPTALTAQIELHGPNGLTEILNVAADGTFARRGLQPGRYCLKVSAEGFRSTMGTAIIDHSAREGARYEIDLIIAE